MEGPPQPPALPLLFPPLAQARVPPAFKSKPRPPLSTHKQLYLDHLLGWDMGTGKEALGLGGGMLGSRCSEHGLDG